MKKLLSILALIMIAFLAQASHPVIPVKTDSMLILAVKDGNYKFIKKLLKSGNAFVNELGIDQKTAMDIAVEFGDSKIAILLSKYGGKVTRADNSYQFKSMLRNCGKKKLITFACMFLLCWLPLSYFSIAICAAEVSLGYLALAIPVGLGILVYAGYEWTSLFKGISMYSKAERSWMIQIPNIA